MVETRNIADRYIQDNLVSFAVTLSNGFNNLQSAILLYNQVKLDESLSEFKKIASRDTSMFEAKKYAEIVALHLLNYDKAILYIGHLEFIPVLIQRLPFFIPQSH